MSKPNSARSSALSVSRLSRLTGTQRPNWTTHVALGAILVACGSDEGSPNGNPGTGGTVGSGGFVSSGGSTVATGGIKSAATGGTITSVGGSAPAATGGSAPVTGSGGSGGSAAPSTGGTAVAGAPPSGGTGGSGGSGPKGGAGAGGTNGGTASGGTGGKGGAAAGGAGTGTGGAGSGTCQKGTTKGNEVLFIGESFIAGSSIPEETTKLARAAGSLGANDSYVDKSVSGTWIGNSANNSIPNQYKNNSNGVRFVLMNGGGNDCWMGGQETHRTAALNAAKTLFQDMQTKGVEKIVYFFYPDPIGANHANLTACLNLLRPDMKSLCEGQAAPKCYWVDLRETWNGHPEYAAMDGIHVAGPGNAPTAAAIFKSMQANCVAP